MANEGLYDHLKNLIDRDHEWIQRVEQRQNYFEGATRTSLERHDNEDAAMFAKLDERVKKLEMLSGKMLFAFGAIQIMLMIGLQVIAKALKWL